MGSKYWLVFLILATAVVVESTTTLFNDPALAWGAANYGHGLSDLDQEFMLDSEINHRLLAQRKRYISYGALKANTVPCNRRGRSYYNCNSRQRANPYKRGCSVITKCKRFTH